MLACLPAQHGQALIRAPEVPHPMLASGVSGWPLLSSRPCSCCSLAQVPLPRRIMLAHGF